MMALGEENEDAVTNRVRTREENRRRLHEVLNPAFMSAEQNKDIVNYPAKGWQDEGCTGRWDGFKALWGTYKSVSDHELKFLTYVPVDIGKPSCPLLISWHGGGFVSEAVACAICWLINVVHWRCRLHTMGCAIRCRSRARGQRHCCIVQLSIVAVRQRQCSPFGRR
jgi:hypothetical protein